MRSTTDDTRGGTTDAGAGPYPLRVLELVAEVVRGAAMTGGLLLFLLAVSIRSAPATVPEPAPSDNARLAAVCVVTLAASAQLLVWRRLRVVARTGGAR